MRAPLTQAEIDARLAILRLDRSPEPMEIWKVFAVAGFALAILVCHATWGWVPLLDYLNLAIHEAGHPLTAIVWQRLEPYGGTIFQIAFPVAIALHFHRRGEPASAAVCEIWLAESLLNVARYMADARLQELPLVGGGDHDWTRIFGERWGVLHLDGFFAGATRLAAVGLMVWALWRLYRAWQVSHEEVY